MNCFFLLKKGFFSSVFFIILLILITAAVVATNIYDRDNSEEIHVTVDKNLVKETAQNEETQNKISIFVFDPGTRTIYEREIAIPRQVNLIEGDFINGIIRNSNYITDDMKFRSAYNLRIDNVNTTGLRRRGVFGANFAVLRGSNSPSILVELGFMNNYSDLSQYLTPDGQERAANAIGSAIRSYFR